MKSGTSGGIRNCLFVLLGVFLLFVIGIVILNNIPPYVSFVSKSKQCFGTNIYLDGHFSFKVQNENESLILYRGWHVITAKKRGYTQSTIRIWIEGNEERGCMLIILFCSGKAGSGKLKMVMK